MESNSVCNPTSDIKSWTTPRGRVKYVNLEALEIVKPSPLRAIVRALKAC